MENRFYTTHEVAKMCQVTRSSVSRWIREGKLKTAVTPGGHHRILGVVVKNFLKSMRMPLPFEWATEVPIKVLIVEDESKIRDMIRKFFKSVFPQMEVQEAEDGFSAGSKVTEFLPDLVVLDLNLPHIDGFRVSQLIKSNPSLQHTKVLIITGAFQLDAEEIIKKTSADDCLFKPFSINLLRDKVKKILEIEDEEVPQ